MRSRSVVRCLLALAVVLLSTLPLTAAAAPAASRADQTAGHAVGDWWSALAHGCDELLAWLGVGGGPAAAGAASGVAPTPTAPSGPGTTRLAPTDGTDVSTGSPETGDSGPWIDPDG